jgi:hypothetical protein
MEATKRPRDAVWIRIVEKCDLEGAIDAWWVLTCQCVDEKLWA